MMTGNTAWPSLWSMQAIRARRNGLPPKPVKWNYAHFGNAEAATAQPDEVFDMLFEKQNATIEGFNQWTINGTAYPMDQMTAKPMFHLREGKRYRIRMKNASDDIHPIHLHRHSFELTRIAGQAMSGLMKDVVMVGGYQEAEVDFIADNPGTHLIPLPPATPYGLRLYVRCSTTFREGGLMMACLSQKSHCAWGWGVASTRATARGTGTD